MPYPNKIGPNQLAHSRSLISTFVHSSSNIVFLSFNLLANINSHEGWPMSNLVGNVI